MLFYLKITIFVPLLSYLKLSPKVSHKAYHKALPKVAPKVNPKVNPKSSPKVASKVASNVAPKVAPKFDPKYSNKAVSAVPLREVPKAVPYKFLTKQPSSVPTSDLVVSL